MPKHIRNGKIVGGAIGIARNLFFDKTKKNLLAAENVQDAVDELSEGINNNANNAALASQTLGYAKKNLIPYPYYVDTGTIQGVTYTVNEDTSITANGTAIEDSYFSVVGRGTFDNTLKFPEGKRLVLTGSPAGGGPTTYIQFLQIVNKDSTIKRSYTDYGDGAEYTVENGYGIGIVLCVKKGTTVSNLTFYPMLRDANIIDDTWEPYVPSVDERINALWAAINELNSQG